MSGCCGMVAVLESIWLLLPGKRQKLGEVPRCSKVSCQKVIGDVKGDIKGHEWSLMLRYHPQPPYNFIEAPYGLAPETAPKDAWQKPVQLPLSGQDRAVAHEDREEHD